MQFFRLFIILRMFTTLRTVSITAGYRQVAARERCVRNGRGKGAGPIACCRLHADLL